MNITKALFIVVAIAAAMFAAWFSQRRPAEEKPVEVQQQGIPDDPDGRVLQQLVAAGADLSKPHNVEFFLFLPDQERATQACRTLQSEGYRVKVEPVGAEKAKWQCMATKSLVPSYAEITTISRRMEDLSKMHGGSYNGWGTPVVK